MGARVVRMFRNFNLENRVHREISKEKPRVAPRHAANPPPSAGSSEAVETAESVNLKHDPLLSLLRSVYVESTDPEAAKPSSSSSSVSEEAERRPLKFSLPGDLHGLVELTDVPKGKLTIAEALKALSSHQREPQTCTPEKIAQDFSLDLKDTKALLEFFMPFQVQMIPPKTENVKKIKAS
ncbi:NADH dehydrogenase [ubiquinone] 1 alpha subcomplex assembly factor 4 isoform X2 [Chelmon rostratus]|uniref:NADH dehydrogenase [ubiquinone] 1 alpha subcomplex assembly factor 4 isoform X2 n=1 Tax=Chelmon rostratus TaxID=109905 RepID=UPI001BE99A4C|nr:NADH dehydrogenase [ubiquinone] 1 alpha subcomplex assembly factor 4 isoform X2 [Chelmon rostratus]